MTTQNHLDERLATDKFLMNPSEESFCDVFRILWPQLVGFFRARKCETAEDLAQEVMLTAYRKAHQVRDRALFRGWLFKIARNALYRHYTKQAREVDTVGLSEVPDRLAAIWPVHGSYGFEFDHWMGFLNSRERETLVLRFIENREYHEIAAAQRVPIGTVQWRAFRAKRKLMPYLKPPETVLARQAS